jgi:hypothetical protein
MRSMLTLNNGYIVRLESLTWADGVRVTVEDPNGYLEDLGADDRDPVGVHLTDAGDLAALIANVAAMG